MTFLRQLLTPLMLFVAAASAQATTEPKPRVIVTSDAEIDDQCSLVRFLLYANEWDIEGIITTSSQYRWQGHKWPGDDWFDPYLRAYAEVQPNLAQHDAAYPTAAFLRARTVMGNASAEGEMAAPSPGSELIVRSLLDRTDPRPIWLQAWGGVNTIARALKTIEEQHPDRMAEVAAKCRLFFIWEQDDTYQRYIRPTWGKFGILTIISDQFEAIAYRWKQAQPRELHRYFAGPWMRANILRGRGPLTALYHAHENGDFRSEGDSPAFLHTIPTGLRNMESPEWGGWGGRYVRVRENTWLDPVPVADYVYPEGRWFGDNGWGRASLRPNTTSTPEQRARYFEPMWRWSVALQNDFAARAAWCVQSYAEANHPPVVALAHPQDLTAAAGATVSLSARGSTDPDGHALTFRWWHDADASTATGEITTTATNASEATATVPADALPGQTLHFICEVTDAGSPPLTRYRRVVVTVAKPTASPTFTTNAEGALVVPPMVSPEASDFAATSFSLSFRLRWPRGLLPNGQRWLHQGEAPGARLELFATPDSARFLISDGTTTSTLCVPVAPFITCEWVHVTAVRDRDERRLSLYADGQLLATTRPGNPAFDGFDRSASVSPSQPLRLGDTGGEIADLRAFRHALDANQVAGLAAGARLVEQVPVATAAPAPSKRVELPPVIVHIPLTEGEGLVIRERALGLTGTLTGADPDHAWTSSDRGLSLHFDGVDDRVEFSPPAGFVFGDESFTVSLHARWTAAGGARGETLVSQGDGTKGWSIKLTPGGLAFIVQDGSASAELIVPLAATLAEQWVHIVAVRDLTDRRLRLMVNGERLAPAVSTDSRVNGVDGTGDLSNTGPLRLGADPLGQHPFTGELADVRFYRGALDDNQAAATAGLRRNAASNPAERSH
jgi:hypothetical protein